MKIGPVINKKALEKIHSYVGIGKEEGAKLLAGGNILTDGESCEWSLLRTDFIY